MMFRAFVIAAIGICAAAAFPALSATAAKTAAKNEDAAGAAARSTLRELAAARGLAIGTAYNGIPGVYDDTVAREFNVVTPENSMKWAYIHPQPERYDFAFTDGLVAFARDHGLKVRGHTLVWHGANPDWINNGRFSREQAITLLRQHIATVVGHYRDRFPGIVYQWDVVNEAVDDCKGPGACGLRNNTWLKAIGPEYVDIAFRAAREADPKARLYYNDYGMEPSDAAWQFKRAGVLKLLTELRARGVPVDGFGMQFHGGMDMPSVGQLSAVMGRFAALDLDIAVTELDIGAGADKSSALRYSQELLGAQAQAYRRVLDACLSQPRCHTFVMWGFSDAITWRYPDAVAIFDRAYEPKPAYFALRNGLLKNPQDARGELSARGADAMQLVGVAADPRLAKNFPGESRYLYAQNDRLEGSFALGGASNYALTVVARGDYAGGEWPVLRAELDGVKLGEIKIGAPTWEAYRLPLSASTGAHRLSLTYVNDYYALPQDRNVELRSASIGNPGPPLVIGVAP